MGQFINTYLNLPEKFYSLSTPQKVENPQSILYNSSLAKSLGVDSILSADIVCTYLTWSMPIPSITPIAQAYAWHQFWNFTMLWDGRALLLWEWVSDDTNIYDIALKWSWETVFSRGGDGRATLRSVLREYLISEAMYFLWIPTSRSLSVIATWKNVYREQMHQWAILARVMQSHIRIGTFEFAKVFGSQSDMDSLLDYTIQRHYPECKSAKNKAEAFLLAVIEKQTSLITQWLRVGFIHGVMNTDNTHIAGETFDYGPCAFMNVYHPKTVFSSIDIYWRYAFDQQSKIIEWNLWVLGYCLIDYIWEDHLQKILTTIWPKLQEKWRNMMAYKLGIIEVWEADTMLIQELLDWMQQHQADYTNTFVYLSGYKNVPSSQIYNQQSFISWKDKWEKRISKYRWGEKGVYEYMQKINPFIIPRNHIVEEVLDSTISGNMEPFYKFLSILAKPYEYWVEKETYMSVPKDFDEWYHTFCGT